MCLGCFAARRKFVYKVDEIKQKNDVEAEFLFTVPCSVLGYGEWSAKGADFKEKKAVTWMYSSH